MGGLRRYVVFEMKCGETSSRMSNYELSVEFSQAYSPLTGEKRSGRGAAIVVTRWLNRAIEVRSSIDKLQN